jgi:hypothetical protein
MIINLLCLGLVIWGAAEILSGIRILLYIPLVLFARLFAKPIRFDAESRRRRALERAKTEEPSVEVKVDGDGIPYL